MRKLGPSRPRKCGMVAQLAGRQAKSRKAGHHKLLLAHPWPPGLGVWQPTWLSCASSRLGRASDRLGFPISTGCHAALPQRHSCDPVWSLVDITQYLVNTVPVGAAASSSWDGAPGGASRRHDGGRPGFCLPGRATSSAIHRLREENNHVLNSRQAPCLNK